MRLKGFSTKAITYSAVCVALAVVLSNIKLFRMPQGGSVSAFGMLFVSLIGYMFGTRIGITAAIARGFIDLAFGVTIVHPVQLLLDYPLAYGALGLSGLTRDKKYGLHTGYLLGVSVRLLITTVSGVIYFGNYTPPGDNAIIYSLGYNLSYIGPEAIATLMIFSVPQVRKLIDMLTYDTAA